jgi:transcriptional regulator with XRE-family HTH domain
MTFPTEFRALRRARRLTQAAAAAACGVTKSAVEKWERGERTPHPLMQEAALAALRAIPPCKSP